MLDLKRQQQTLGNVLTKAVMEVIEKGIYVMSEDITQFESKLAEYCDKPFALGVGSGTAALQIALIASGVKSGAEVITVPNSFFATTEVILNINALPVFVDIEPETHLMNLSLLPQAITDKTQAIMPVHLYGNVVDVEEIQEILNSMNRKDIMIIEDGAHAFGSKLRGKSVPIGECGIFSFNPGKNCGAFGDAGAVVTSNEQIAETVRLLRDHGRIDKCTHMIAGFNSRLGRINEEVLNVKIDHIDSWNLKRHHIIGRYNDAFQITIEVTPVKVMDGVYSAYHQYVVQAERRDALRQYLKEKGISTGIHYPTLLPEQPVFCKLGYNLDNLPVAHSLAGKILSLPCFPDLNEEEIERVIAGVRQFYHLHECNRS
jgi:Predicted pyridoxal phosphate-dependent enzyme apparently involved in regulation of cell wall biogenesis